MSNNSGIFSLYPPAADDENEIREQAKAKAAVMKILNVPNTTLQAAPIAADILQADTDYRTIKSDLYKTPEPVMTKKEREDKKFSEHMEREYGDKTIKQGVLKKIYQNKKAGKDRYHNFSDNDIYLAENIKDEAKKHFQQKNKKILPINVDAKHPDGFTFKNDMDTYDQYKDQPIRYMQEIAYKYDGSPVTETVKPYDHMDKSSYPSNQAAALSSYGKAYNRLTPIQKKQIATAQKIEKKNKPEKLFENIFDKNGLRVNNKK